MTGALISSREELTSIILIDQHNFKLLSKSLILHSQINVGFSLHWKSFIFQWAVNNENLQPTEVPRKGDCEVLNPKLVQISPQLSHLQGSGSITKKMMERF